MLVGLLGANVESYFLESGKVSDKDNQESAFPMDRYGNQGMTLRDWFAGQAMAGMLTIGNLYDTYSEEQVARGAYAQADAMMEARKK